MIEIFLPIKGYEGLYEVSAKGNVRNARTNHVLRAHDNGRGYLNVKLQKNAKSKNHRVHRLVAERFLINPLNLPMVEHRDDNKQNNQASNLMWSTYSKNTTHAYANGLMENSRKACEKMGRKYGAINLKKTLSKRVFQYTQDGRFVAEYPSTNEAKRQTGIHQSAISMCCNGKRNQAGGYKWKYKN